MFNRYINLRTVSAVLFIAVIHTWSGMSLFSSQEHYQEGDSGSFDAEVLEEVRYEQLTREEAVENFGNDWGVADNFDQLAFVPSFGNITTHTPYGLCMHLIQSQAAILMDTISHQNEHQDPDLYVDIDPDLLCGHIRVFLRVIRWFGGIVKQQPLIFEKAVYFGDVNFCMNLNMDADLNGDGEVTYEEAVLYAIEEVDAQFQAFLNDAESYNEAFGDLNTFDFHLNCYANQPYYIVGIDDE